MDAKVWHSPVLHARGALAYQSAAAVFKVGVAWHVSIGYIAANSLRFSQMNLLGTVS